MHKEMNNQAFNSAHVSQCETPHVNISVITQATITTSSVFLHLKKKKGKNLHAKSYNY